MSGTVKELCNNVAEHVARCRKCSSRWLTPPKGPHRVSTRGASHRGLLLCDDLLPGGLAQLPSIVIVGGWGCGEQVQAAWAPFYASHGIVAMTIGTPAPWKDFCEARAIALLDASVALQSEHARAGSVLLGRLDTSNRAVHGYPSEVAAPSSRPCATRR